MSVKVRLLGLVFVTSGVSHNPWSVAGLSRSEAFALRLKTNYESGPSLC